MEALFFNSFDHLTKNPHITAMYHIDYHYMHFSHPLIFCSQFQISMTMSDDIYLLLFIIKVTKIVFQIVNFLRLYILKRIVPASAPRLV